MWSFLTGDDVQKCILMSTKDGDFHFNPSFCHVKSSSRHGNGLFATRDINPGEIVTFYPVHQVGFTDKNNSDKNQILGLTSELYPDYQLLIDESLSIFGIPDIHNDDQFLGHMINDPIDHVDSTDLNAFITRYMLCAMHKSNVKPRKFGGLWVGFEATKLIPSGSEVLFPYLTRFWFHKFGVDADEAVRKFHKYIEVQPKERMTFLDNLTAQYSVFQKEYALDK
jgi:hypothetical protein